ncbi:hypothetical protein E1B28_004987 [Marasmius oreades]|uniref:Uncharacterized protein n=1 Tax=Marasmius oreades TaxID=181124 RepID=A0A9P7UZP2_9AGAR|nr:uncharacterized protein E1B28_004987 [Marasmius oreades]KAG7097659.1 hypothetical protein E1B28_004987 [Marasmius oreades]
MSFFQGANGVSIGQGTFNVVTGNQTNNNNIYNHYIAERQKKKRRIYDEFPDIQRGLVHRLKDVDHKDGLFHWNFGSHKYEVEFKVERTISTAKIHGDSSTFTVVSYKGQDAQKAWEKEFRRFSETTNTTKMQLFGINRSRIPLLIFYGELLPLDHFWDELGDFGLAYARTLSDNMNWGESEIWIDPAQGTLVRGVKGPGCDLTGVPLTDEPLPSSVELLLNEDVYFRFFSRFPLDKELDRRTIHVIEGISTREERGPLININQPFVFSSKTNFIITIESGVFWYGDGVLGSRVCMPDGRTRFTLEEECAPCLFLDSFCPIAWLSQASSVFLRLGISLDEELWSSKLIVPVVNLRGSIENSSIKQQRRSEHPPIYLFRPLPPFPLLGDDSVLSTHTWSHDKNGETPFAHHHCEYLGLPTKLYERSFSTHTYRWSSSTYKRIHKWQIARGFDPTTADFARYLEHPIYKVLPESEAGRFEELNMVGPMLDSL